MRVSFIATLALIPTLLAPGCLLEPDDAERTDEDVRVELPPQPLPLEGSPTAYGMLRVVNELGFAALDREVGLDRQAAQSILAHRIGPDGYLGTADDRFVQDLEELDGLYWLGESNLWRIHSHALLEGYAPQAVPDGCDPALADALAACRRFVAEITAEPGEGAQSAALATWGCLEADEDGMAAEFFAQQGLSAYREPALGYHAMLCESAEADATAPVCTLGVAGLAAHALGECVAPGG